MVSSVHKSTNPRFLLTGALLLLTATSFDVIAQESSDSPDLFSAKETSLDLFGSASAGQQTVDHLSGLKINRDLRLGAGAGLNYFMTRNFGFGADAYSENIGHSFIDSTSINLIGRLPLGTSGFAPYAYGGVGHQFDPNGVWFGQAGAGIEYRFTRKFGTFVDARYVFTDGTSNYGLARIGIRCTF